EEHSSRGRGGVRGGTGGELGAAGVTSLGRMRRAGRGGAWEECVGASGVDGAVGARWRGGRAARDYKVARTVAEPVSEGGRCGAGGMSGGVRRRGDVRGGVGGSMDRAGQGERVGPLCVRRDLELVRGTAGWRGASGSCGVGAGWRARSGQGAGAVGVGGAFAGMRAEMVGRGSLAMAVGLEGWWLGGWGWDGAVGSEAM
ncbi:hypothetical protein Tco_0403788, partial [Tanacetum coccineum]